MPKVITYVVSMASASEAKKPTTKRATKHATCQVRADLPWSTLQAQLLIKISDALKPKIIDFANYEALFHIPRLLSKPGMVLAGDADYQILLQRVASIKENVEPEKDKVDSDCHCPPYGPYGACSRGTSTPSASSYPHREHTRGSPVIV